MAKTQAWVALTAVAVVGVLAAGWFLLVAPRRADAADLREQATSQRSAVAALQVQVATLQAQAEGLPAQQARLDAVQEKMPAQTAVPELIRAITGAAASSGVELVSLVPGQPTPMATAVGATAARGSGDVQALPLTMTLVGNYPEIERYLAALESLPRATRVSGLTLAPGLSPTAATGNAGAPAAVEDGSSLKVNITGEVYVLAASPTTSATTTTAPATATPAPGTPTGPGPAATAGSSDN